LATDPEARVRFPALPENKNSGTLYPQKLAITPPTSGGRSVGIVRSRTQTMEFVLFCLGLERGPLSLVSTTEKLLDRKVAAPV
jgi:hypothetical protein